MSPPQGKPSSILIVEDESVVAMDIEANLQRLGYEITASATSAEEAIRCVRDRVPDLILMDIQLHGAMDGVAAAQEINLHHDVPVVFLTANVNDETIARATQSASFGYLNKPFRPRELNATIEIALHQHRAGRELFAERSWLRTMLCSISDGVIATDADGVIRFLNPKAAELTGWRISDAVGEPLQHVYSLTRLNGEPLPTTPLREALQHGKPVPKQQLRLQSSGGATRAVEDATAPIVENGRVRGAVTVFLDISARLRKEELSREERERLSEQVHLTFEALGQTREELQSLSRHLMVAQEEERRRIARELHDDLGQQAALLGMKVSRLEMQAPADLRETVAQLRAGLDTLTQGLREVSHRLHPAMIEDLGLREALDALVHEFRREGLAIKASLAHSDVPLEVGTALFRIAQESLRNVLRHAPGSSVRVTLSCNRADVDLRISDDGQGFSLGDVRHRGGLGLVSMQERARLVGGNLLLTAEPDKGTTVLVRVPLRS